MTDYTDLIERLRAPVPTVYDCKDAADALKAKDRRISELEKMLAVHRLAVDVDALKARIAELEAALRPFAELDAHWAGDKMPLQPKSVMLNPLPILYAIKALKND